MKIGSFLDNQLNKNITYSYHERGLDIPYAPDAHKEAEEHAVYTKDNGNLFFRSPVSWKDTQVFRRGVDIRFSLGECCFVDHVYMEQGRGGALASVEVFTVCSGKFIKIGNYAPESGKLITSSEIKIGVGSYCDNLVLRLNGDCMPVVIKTLDILGAFELDNSLWPTPASGELSYDSFPLTLLKTVSAKGDDAAFAAEHLCSRLLEKTGYAPSFTDGEGDIVIEICEASASGRDSFSLNIEAGKCYISAPSRLCLIYAVEALLQRLRADSVLCCSIKDEAFAEFRGVHFALPARKDMEFLRNMVKHVFLPMRYNTVFIQVSAAMRYDKYPEINDAWLNACEKYEQGEYPKPPHYGFVSRDILEKSEVRALIDYLEAFGLEVIPEVQSWAHVQYITMAYPEYAEKIAVKQNSKALHLSKEDAMPDSFYYHCMCPSHPDYYKITFGVLEEVLEVFRPKRFVHMGHDEIYYVGKCSRCSEIPRGDIFAEEVTRLYEHLKERGLGMMIWSDMLHSQREHATPTAINKIPKEIVMLDFVWYFHTEQDIEDNLLSHGFKVMMGNMYSSHYPRYESRSHKAGIIGGEVSTWVTCNELSYAYEGKIFDFVYSAELLWNKDYRSEMRLSNYEIVKPLLGEMRYRIGNLVCDAPERRVEVGGCADAIPFDIRGIAPYKTAVAAGCLCPEVSVEIGSKAEIITFTHATSGECVRKTWHDPFGIGEYVITYEDGTSYTEPLYYAANIYKYNAPFGDRVPSSFFRHEGYIGTYLTVPECGKTYNGEDYTLGKYSLRNPSPEKTVSSVTLRHSGTASVDIILFAIDLK